MRIVQESTRNNLAMRCLAFTVTHKNPDPTSLILPIATVILTIGSKTQKIPMTRGKIGSDDSLCESTDKSGSCTESAV
jgi:hypothetical protein